MAMTRDRTHVTERALPSVDEGRHEPDWASRLPVNAKTTAIATRAYGWGRSGFGEHRIRPAFFSFYLVSLPICRTGSSQCLNKCRLVSRVSRHNLFPIACERRFN